MSAHRLGRFLALALAAGVLGPAAIGSAGAAVIVDRLVFYNNSTFDGSDPNLTAADDGAIAADKTALLPGQTATFANVTSYDKGINGIMFDITGPFPPLFFGDFQFRAGTTADPTTWAAAPAPLSLAVRPIAGSNRVTVAWADGAITNAWLQVTVLANAATGLAAPDVFYFGNLVGETGDDPSALAVTAADLAAIAANNGAPVDVTDPYDINRDGAVGDSDHGLALQQVGVSLINLQAPLPGAGGPGQQIPEPASLALLAVGLAGLGVVGRRRRR